MQLTGSKGFSLVEVMIAASIISMGLAGVSLLLLTAISGTAEAGHRTIATNSSGSLAELIAMSGQTAEHYTEPPIVNGLTCDQPDNCTDDQRTHAELLNWQHQLAEALPGGTGLVCRDSTPDDGNASEPACDGHGLLVVKVFWTEPVSIRHDDDGHRRLVTLVP